MFKHPTLGGFQHFPFTLENQSPCWSDLALLLPITQNPTPRLSPMGSIPLPSNSAPRTGSLGVMSGVGYTIPLPGKATFEVLGHETEEEGRVLP